MSNSQSVAMDVDGPSTPNGGGGGGGPGTLKRCSSAPMINDTGAVMSATGASSSNREQQSFNIFGSSSHIRTRRFSASQVPGSPVSALRLTPRINQLRQEEHEGISNTRELAHEREIHHAMQISQSWEDLSIMNDSSSNENSKSAKTGPLHISLPNCGSGGGGCGGFLSNSPSPTRMGFQSPTRSRTIIRRSASPVLRPSPLGVKRKLDDDKSSEFQVGPRAKRVYSYSGADRGGLLTTTGGSLSSVGTPESLSSADSPSGFNFRNVDSPSPSRALPVESMVISKSDQEMTEGPS